MWSERKRAEQVAPMSGEMVIASRPHCCRSRVAGHSLVGRWSWRVARALRELISSLIERTISNVFLHGPGTFKSVEVRSRPA